jgi:hypothetical protein
MHFGGAMFFTDYSMSPMELSDTGANHGCEGPTARRRVISRMSDGPQTDGELCAEVGDGLTG